MGWWPSSPPVPQLAPAPILEPPRDGAPPDPPVLTFVLRYRPKDLFGQGVGAYSRLPFLTAESRAAWEAVWWADFEITTDGESDA